MGSRSLNKIPVQVGRRFFIVSTVFSLLAGCSGANSPNLASKSIDRSQDQIQPTQSPLQQQAKVKVALLLPLSDSRSSAANVAKSLKQSGELALFEFDNPSVLLITKDTKGTPEGAREAATAAIQSGAELIIGPLFSKSVTAVSPIARQANVPVIAFSSDQSVAGNGVYLLSFLAGRDVPRIVSYARSQGKSRFAALIPDNAYGTIVESAFQNAVRKSGGQILKIARYPSDPNGMLKPAKSISALAKKDNVQIDALLLPGGPETLPSLSPLIPYFEIDTNSVQLLGTGRWDYANIGKESSLLGGWYPAAHPQGWRDFAQRYSSTYGKPPPRIASLSYDAVSLALSLSSLSKGQRYSAQQIARPSGFAGVDGLFRFLADGTSERGLSIVEVRKFGSKVIDNAPTSFSNPAQY